MKHFYLIKVDKENKLTWKNNYEEDGLSYSNKFIILNI